MISDAVGKLVKVDISNSNIKYRLNFILDLEWVRYKILGNIFFKEYCLKRLEPSCL